ncbi:Fic family protein [Actinokineospora sp.]|uniref:Fic family protein n=1 Tax=Actinokineospora sp. TaxID=1872133 RepID=UPI003D6BBF16
MIRSQYEALQFLAELAREQRPLTTSLIRQLHVALTRTQQTYSATGPAGIRFEATLRHGDWKQSQNSVIRPDGSRLDYTPPEQVQSQMDRLVDMYNEMDDVNPIIRSAWLHHRFVRGDWSAGYAGSAGSQGRRWASMVSASMKRTPCLMAVAR